MQGIDLSSAFTENAQQPLDLRIVQADITARNAIPVFQRYDGLFVYLISTNETWQLQAGITNSDWVLISSGGSGGFTYINEVVAGSGTSFALAHTPIDATRVALYGGGSRLTPTDDYTISGATITMTNAYSSGQVLADYS